MSRTSVRPRSPLATLGIAVGFLALALLSSVTWQVSWLALDTWANVRALQGAGDSAGALPTRAARGLVQDAALWRKWLTPVIAAGPYLAWVPVYGGDLEQLPQAARVLDQLLDASEPTLALADRLESQFAQGQSAATALLAVAQTNAGELAAARNAVGQVTARRDALDERRLSPTGHTVLRRLDVALAAWDSGLALVERAPVLLGADAPRRYLVLAQNNDEIRPTGGFISAVGIVRVEQGDIHIEWFGDSYAADDLELEHPPAPAPLEKYMWASQWLVRDSNWYADFPTSARIAQDMVEHDRAAKTDGVIALDSRLVPLLVGAVSGLELDGAPLEPANVMARLKASWKPLPAYETNPTWYENDRKNFLGELFGALMLGLQSGKARPARLAQAFVQGLDSKSLQIYVDDDAAEAALNRAGWGGAVSPGEGDYVYPVDANVGFNKVNATINRALHYAIDLSSKPTVVVELTYHNPSAAADGGCDLLKQHKDETYASMEQSCYWDYVRVLVPRGSQLVRASGLADAGIADDIEQVTAFGGYAVVPRNSSRAVQFEYQLPQNPVRDGVYALRVQQQPGLAPTPVTVRVKLPIGAALLGTSHPFTRLDAQTIELGATISRDTTFRVFLK